MSTITWKKDRDVIVFINSIDQDGYEAVESLAKKLGRPLRSACIVDVRDKKALEACKADIVIPCRFASDAKILQSLAPYRDRFLAITGRGEVSVERLSHLIPHVPYLRISTYGSLRACIDKVLMRQLLRAYCPDITPRFVVVHNSGAKTMENIVAKVGFPLVIKPSGLASSQLVSICFHQEELELELRRTMRKIKALYRQRGTEKEPQVLVEQYMDGEMYSIDSYVSDRGQVVHAPIVKVRTGRSIGFDDFFGYSRMTPTLLKEKDISAAEKVAEHCVAALGLRSSTAHVELMRTDEGWKIIELGARMGGYRQLMYRLSYGFSHMENDILNRIPERLSVPRKVKAHTMVLEFFAKEEGYLSKLIGVRKARKLVSMHSITAHVKDGGQCLFAKNGGKRVVSAVLTNKSRSDLLADVRRLEQMLVIETSRRRPS